MVSSCLDTEGAANTGTEVTTTQANKGVVGECNLSLGTESFQLWSHVGQPSQAGGL